MYARMRYKIVSETIHIVMAGTISRIAVIIGLPFDYF